MQQIADDRNVILGAALHIGWASFFNSNEYKSDKDI